MPRPCKLRFVECNPGATHFKPCGRSGHKLEAVSMTVDELEAIRLADLEGLYQEEAARRMNISRQTFGNIISSAHRKVADSLIHSKYLTITGGSIVRCGRRFQCSRCEHTWALPSGTARPCGCPNCSSTDIHYSSQHRNREGRHCCARGQSISRRRRTA